MGNGRQTQFSAGPYRLTQKEYASVARAAKQSLQFKTYVCIVSALVVIALQLLLWGALLLTVRVAFDEPPSPPIVIGGIAAAGVAAILLFFRVIGPGITRSQFSRLSASRFDYLVTLRDGTVDYSLGKIAVSMPWGAVDRVVDKRGCIFLFLDDLAAVIVPRRVFTNNSDAEAFLALAQTRWKIAHGAA